jgi:hypothetical protein
MRLVMAAGRGGPLIALWLAACGAVEAPQGSGAQAGEDEFLTERQRAKALEFTQVLCPSRWCVGAREFTFLGVSCRKSTWSCVVGVIGWEDAEPSKRRDLSCTVGGVTGPDQILLRRKTTELWNQAIDDCLADFAVHPAPGAPEPH